MKKIIAVMLVAMLMSVVTGCSDDQERIDNAAEQALEAQDKARDAVDAVNEQTLELEQQAQELDAE